MKFTDKRGREWVVKNLAEGLSMSWEDWCWKAWQAAKAQAVPDGFVLAPVEPTERMLDSAYSSISDNLHYADLENIYRAMIWSAQGQAND